MNGDLDDVEWSAQLETERLSLNNWTAGFGMARVLRMSDHPAEGTVRAESGLTDDDFSPMDPRPQSVGNSRDVVVVAES